MLAALAKLERIDEARTAAERVLARQPNFSSGGQCTAVGDVAALAHPLIGAGRCNDLDQGQEPEAPGFPSRASSVAMAILLTELMHKTIQDVLALVEAFEDINVLSRQAED